MDYLKDLGVDYLWLTPFFVSPQRDNGYDVADYRNIDPMFGTMEDLDNLIAEGEKRNIGLMFDMVFNHTSTSHEWFRRALAGEKKYQDYYIFKEGAPDQPPTNWQSKFGGSAWEYVSSLGKWYLHLFDVTQADLNWKNPEVREELKEVIRFWKAKGVKGFRFDVVNLISKPEIWEDDFEGDGRKFYTDGPYVHEYLKELVRDTGIEDYVTVGEMSSTTLEHCIRYSGAEEKELSMCFNFHHLKVDYKDGNKWELMEPDYMELKVIFEKWQMGMQRGNAWNALFWCNHDQPRMSKPSYNSIKNEDIKEIEIEGGKIRLLAGKYGEHEGYKGDYLSMDYYDIHLNADAEVTLTMEEDDSVMVFTLLGDVYIDGEHIEEKTAVKLTEGDSLTIKNGNEKAQVLYMNSRALNEPVAWAGPIVMNTQEELQKAFLELRSNTFIKETAEY